MVTFMIAVHLLMAHIFTLADHARRIRGAIGPNPYHVICHVRSILKAGVHTKYGVPVVRMVCTGYVRLPK